MHSSLFLVLRVGSRCRRLSLALPPLPASCSSTAPVASKVKLKRILDMLKDRITSEAFETACAIASGMEPQRHLQGSFGVEVS